MGFYLTPIRVVIINKTYNKQGTVVYGFVPALGKQRQVDLCESQATKDYIVWPSLKRWETERVREREGESKRAQKNHYMKISVNPLHTHTRTHTSTLNTDLQYHPATDSISPASPVEPPSLVARGTLSKLHETPNAPPLLFWAVRGVALVDQSFGGAAWLRTTF